jgi:hypothetical protein
LPSASTGCGPAFIGEPSLEWIIQPQIRPPMPSCLTSSPVNTATTPGAFAAADTSIPSMVAWACGERTK